MKRKKSGNKIDVRGNNYVFKLLCFVCVFVLLCIICKGSVKFKNLVYDNVYNNSFSFVGIKELYNKYLGGIIPLSNFIKDDNTEMVFNESLSSSSFSKYLDGAKADVGDNHLVSVLDSGMVIFVGEKEGYGNVVIVETLSGVDIWYGNISNSYVKLYDYIEKGSYVGEVSGEFYLVFCKNGKFLDYDTFIDDYYG